MSRFITTGSAILSVEDQNVVLGWALAGTYCSVRDTNLWIRFQ